MYKCMYIMNPLQRTILTCYSYLVWLTKNKVIKFFWNRLPFCTCRFCISLTVSVILCDLTVLTFFKSFYIKINYILLVLTCLSKPKKIHVHTSVKFNCTICGGIYVLVHESTIVFQMYFASLYHIDWCMTWGSLWYIKLTVSL